LSKFGQMNKQKLFIGQKGEYYGTLFNTLPVKEKEKIRKIDRNLRELGFSLLGKLTSSHLGVLQVYAYKSEDECLCASITKTPKSFQGIEFVTRLADDTYLTTTTTKLTIDHYEDQKLFRFSYPQLDAVSLFNRHLEHLISFKEEHGKPEKIFSDLRSVAITIDDYLTRQESNPIHGMLNLINALGILRDSKIPNSEAQIPVFEGQEPTESNQLKFNYKPEDAETSLMRAILADDLATVFDLLGEGVNPNQWDSSCEYTPLGMAIERGNSRMVRLLLNGGANINGGDSVLSSLGLAAKKGAGEIAEILLEAGIDINEPVDEDGYTALMEAAFAGHLPMVQLLLANGADINIWAQGETAIHWAARGCNQEIYDFLYPLVNEEIRQWADEEGIKTIQVNLKRQARKQNKTVEEFIDAAMLGKLEEVQAAIAKGIDVNALGSTGCTALMYAANYGYIPVIQSLLKAGADPNILSDDDVGLGDGKTALMFASESFFAKNRHEVVRLLVEGGADVNLRGKGGEAALMCADGSGFTKCVETLIKLGANVDA
jgi:ankyrin repeat protein